MTPGFENNPYAPPRAEVLPGRGSGVDYYREGDLLVVRKGATLPLDRCIKTGEPTDGFSWHRKLQWYPPWVGLLVLISPIIFIIVALIVIKRGELTFGVGPKMRKRRLTGISVGWLGSVASIALLILGVMANSAALMFLGFAAFLGCLIAGVLLVQPFRIQKIDQDFIYLKVPQTYLDGLPLGGSSWE